MLRPSWIYDGSEIPDPFGYGERAVKALRTLKHPKSTANGRAFQLDPWQERIVRRIYGPRHPDGRRIVRNVVMLLPRGNRKTSFAAGLALLHTIGPERVPGGEAIFAASDKKQASIGFREAQGIITIDRKLRDGVRIHDAINAAKRISLKKDGTFLETISCDAGTQHGRTPTFVLADELHAWKKRDLWDVLKTGLTKVPGSLLIVATTAGRGQENIAAEIVSYSRKVAKGDIVNEGFLPILFEADASADWQDEALWHAVNPGLQHGYPDIEGLRDVAREAKDRPSDRDAFRQLHLNVWLDHSETPFVDMAIYDEGNAPVDLEALKGQPCWLGVDLSSNRDLTVIVAAWRNGDDGYLIHPWFFCPADNLRGRADLDGVPYPHWAEQGFITPTHGNVVDFHAVEDKLRELCADYDVREIAFDPHLGRNMIANLLQDGYPAVEMRQGWITMAPAIKELERAIIGRKLKHGDHPVLRWNFDNIVVETDKAGNMSFHKGKSRDKIDGAVAAAMAVSRASFGGGEYSLYNDPTLTAEDFVLA